MDPQKHILDFNPSPNPQTPNPQNQVPAFSARSDVLAPEPSGTASAGAPLSAPAAQELVTSPNHAPTVVPAPNSPARPRSAATKRQIKLASEQLAIRELNGELLEAFLRQHRPHKAFYKRMKVGIVSMTTAMESISSKLVGSADHTWGHKSLKGIEGLADTAAIPIASGLIKGAAAGARVLIKQQEVAHLKSCVVEIETWTLEGIPLEP